MATLFQKARIAVLSVAHSLLDKVIDLNSVEAVKQYVRDLEVSLQGVNNELAGARADQVGATRKIALLTADQKKFNGQIDALLGDADPSNDHQASALEARLMGIEENLTAEQGNLETAKTTVTALEQVVSTLRTKHESMLQQLTRLGSLERQAKAKETAAAALISAKDALSGGADASVDNVAARIQKRADVADQKLAMAQGDFNTLSGQDQTLSEVAARLAQRKARLAAAQSTASAQ